MDKKSIEHVVDTFNDLIGVMVQAGSFGGLPVWLPSCLYDELEDLGVDVYHFERDSTDK